MRKIRFYAGREHELTVHFEILGGVHVVAAGDRIDVEFADSEEPCSVEHHRHALVLTQEGDGFMRVRDSAGREIDPSGEIDPAAL
ncbi:hypothetical protein [Streptomyces sp. NPDC002133]|uniref:hypothetical protein n=1 Tax=Streptomyces sp. NPDC002133 TaxID=3154409 RepID=UPI0033293D68